MSTVGERERLMQERVVTFFQGVCRPRQAQRSDKRAPARHYRLFTAWSTKGF
jgi:hypothetical protein